MEIVPLLLLGMISHKMLQITMKTIDIFWFVVHIWNQIANFAAK